jgi:hypothetical protein
MQWKREGNELEWIVRQMSWQPPWTNRGQADIKQDVRNRSMAIDKKAPGHTRTLAQPFTATNPSDVLRQFTKDAAARVGDELSSDECSVRDEASVGSHTESIAASEILKLASSQHSDGDITDDDVKMQGLDLLEDAQMVDAAPLPALQSLTTTLHPEQVWRKLPLACVADRWGYGRSPAF